MATKNNPNKISFFNQKEIKSITPAFYGYVHKKKIVTYLPVSHLDKVTFELANAKAGKIGDYSLCSFRMKGVGTFLPSRNSKPFTGKKGKLAFEEEVRLEMEIAPVYLDNAIDTLLEVHPYEEPAYEIYDFTKRNSTPSGYVIELKKKMNLADIVKKISRSFDTANIKENFSFDRVLYCDGMEPDSNLISKALMKNCQIIICTLNKKIIFKKI